MASAAKAPETLPPMARLMRETKFARGEEYAAAEKSAYEKSYSTGKQERAAVRVFRTTAPKS